VEEKHLVRSLASFLEVFSSIGGGENVNAEI